MEPHQLAFDVAAPAGAPPGNPAGTAADPAPDAVPAPVAGPAPSPVRRRQALIDFLEEVTRRVREAAAEGDGATRPSATLRHTVRNAQLIAARARRAIDALPGTDLELLRAHGRLLAATREAQEARRAAEFAAGGRIFSRCR